MLGFFHSIAVTLLEALYIVEYVYASGVRYFNYHHNGHQTSCVKSIPCIIYRESDDML